MRIPRSLSAPISGAFAAQGVAAGLLLIAFVLSGELRADDARCAVYVSAAKDRTLYAYALDGNTGKLSEQDKISLSGSPGPQCLHPNGETLYVSVRSSKTVAAFRLDRATGRLKLRKESPLGNNATYIATDKTGRWLLTASYSDGRVASHALEKDGSVGELITMIETERCAHAILPDAANRYVLVPHTCPNSVYQFRFDATSGRLSANDPAQVSPAAGLEPRHLAFHPRLDVIYFDDEKGSSVTAYRYDSDKGTVEPFQTTSTLPTDYTGKNTCADIEISRDARFVYASNRGHDSIAAFSVSSTTGALKALGQFPTGKTPRSFNLSPDNRWLVAAGQSSNDLTTYRRDAQTGRLERLKSYPTGRSPAWVEIVALED